MDKVVLGDCELYLGDCLDIMPALVDIDAVIADVPYGINGGKGGQSRKYGKGKYETNGWEDSEAYIAEHVVPVIMRSIEIAKRVAITPGIRCLYLYPRAQDIGCFWTPAAANRGPWGFTTFNPILYYGKDYRAGRGALPTGIQVTERADKNGHPCPKPLKAWTWLVEKVSQRGETVLDPFMGSGTTGVASIQTGRKFIGIEIEPKYFDLAVKRIREAQMQLRLL